MAQAILRQDVLTAPVGTDIKVFFWSKAITQRNGHCYSSQQLSHKEVFRVFQNQGFIIEEEGETHLLCKGVEVIW